MSPLIIRLLATATVQDLIQQVIQRASASTTPVPLPSTDHADYAVCPAAGDGSPLPGAWPLKGATVVRRSGLEFPYMLSLTYLHLHPAGEGEAPEMAPEKGRAHGSRSAGTVPDSTGKVLVRAEKEAVDAHRARVANLREQRVAEIERQREERERRHFQQCESYEVYRKEQVSAERKAKEDALRKAQAAEEAKELRAEVADEHAKVKQQSLLEAHRRAVEEKLADQSARQEALAAERLEAEARAQATKRAAEEARRREREEGREQRVHSVSDRILRQLDVAIDREREEEEARILRERMQRQADERAAIEVRRVEHLEHTRFLAKEAERNRRCEEARQLERSRQDLERTRVEEAERTAQDFQRRYQEWKDNRSRSLEVLESRLEFEYRSGRAS